FGEAEVRELAGWMCDIMDDVENAGTVEQVKVKVLEICKRFPVYG
ncbi:Serine hydroxymethyltransferase, partial [hydrothermal vent metagenome]